MDAILEQMVLYRRRKTLPTVHLLAAEVQERKACPNRARPRLSRKLALSKLVRRVPVLADHTHSAQERGPKSRERDVRRFRDTSAHLPQALALHAHGVPAAGTCAVDDRPCILAPRAHLNRREPSIPARDAKN